MFGSDDSDATPEINGNTENTNLGESIEDDVQKWAEVDGED